MHKLLLPAPPDDLLWQVIASQLVVFNDKEKRRRMKWKMMKEISMGFEKQGKDVLIKNVSFSFSC